MQKSKFVLPWMIFFIVFILITACQGTKIEQFTPTQTYPPHTATMPASPVSTSPPPTPLSTSHPSAIVIHENARLLDAPIAFIGDTAEEIIFHYDVQTLQENLPVGTQLTVIGKYLDCAALNVILPDGTSGWVRQYGFPPNQMESNRVLKLNCECDAIPEGMYRPRTGSIQGGRGSSPKYDTLLIENQTPFDMIVLLIDTDENNTVLYIRSEDNFEIWIFEETIIYIAFGRTWLVNSGRFKETFAQYRVTENKGRDRSQGNWDTVEFKLTFSGVIRGEEIEGLTRINEFPSLIAP